MDATLGLVIELAMLLFGSSPLVVLRSCPPLPPDPVIARSAPDTCFAHLAFHGLATPDPNSANVTERLASDKELQRFVTQCGSALGKGIASILAEGDPTMLAPVEHLPSVATTLGTRPWSLSLSLEENRTSGEISGSFVMHVGSDGEAFVNALAAAYAAISDDPSPPEPSQEVTVKNRTFRKVLLDEDAYLFWGFHDEYLVAMSTSGDSAAPLESLLERMADDKRAVPAWRAEAGAKVAVERPRLFCYLDAAGLRRKSLAAGWGDPLNDTVLRDFDKIVIGDGMSSKGVQTRWRVEVKDKLAALLPGASDKPLNVKDLAMIPADAIFAQVWRFDASASLSTVAKALAAYDPKGLDDFQAAMEQFRAVFGFDPDRHILKTLGDTWHLFLLPIEEPLEPRIACTVTLRDRPLLMKTHDTLLRLWRNVAPNAENEPPFSVADTDFNGVTIHSVAWPAKTTFSFPLAWCITDEHLIVTTSPQLLRDLVTRGSDDAGLASVPMVAAAIEEGNVTMLGYHDPRPFVKSMDSLLNRLAAMDALDLDLPTLPSASLVTSKVSPGFTVVRAVPGQGMVVESSCTLPLGPLAFGDFVVLAANYWFNSMIRQAMSEALGEAVSKPAASRAGTTEAVEEIEVEEVGDDF